MKIKIALVIQIWIKCQLFSNLFDEPFWTFKDRKFGQRLTFFEKWLIYKEIEFKKKAVFDTWKKFRVSKSTIYKTLKEFKRRGTTNLWSSWSTKRSIRTSKTIADHISKQWCNYPYPFTANDVSKNLHKMLRVRLSEKVISQILKESLGLSFKKGKSWPVTWSKNKQQLLKCLFAIKIIPLISKSKLLINIDETSFSRLTKLDYSWLKKGHPWKLMNTVFKNSTSLITAITSTGKVFAASTNGSVNTLIFKDFLDKLKQFIKEYEDSTLDQWIIVMDNAVTHRSKPMHEYFKENDIRVVYIPPYTPELAPIERLFSVLKHSVLKRSIGRLVDLKSQEADKILSKSILTFDASTIRRLWRTFTTELTCAIDYIDQHT